MARSYNNKMSKEPKINWDALLETKDTDIQLPDTMEPIERMEFIDGILKDYHYFAKISLTDPSLIPFLKKYRKVLSVLVKNYGH